MDSCLETPKAVSVSCGTHLLNLLQSDKRNGKMSALLPLQGRKLANARREGGNACRLFIGLAVNWDYDATLPAYDKDSFSLAHCSLSSVPFSSLFPFLLTTFLFCIFLYCLCFIFYLLSICNLPMLIRCSVFHFRYLPLNPHGVCQVTARRREEEVTVVHCAHCRTAVQLFSAAACAVTGC